MNVYKVFVQFILRPVLLDEVFKYFVEIEESNSILSRFGFSFVLGPTSRKTWSNKPDGECVSELFQGQRPILLLPFLGDQYFNFEMFLDHIFPKHQTLM